MSMPSGHAAAVATPADDPFTVRTESHVLLVAPTRAGKSRGFIVSGCENSRVGVPDRGALFLKGASLSSSRICGR